MEKEIEIRPLMSKGEYQFRIEHETHRILVKDRSERTNITAVYTEISCLDCGTEPKDVTDPDCW